MGGKLGFRYPILSRPALVLSEGYYRILPEDPITPNSGLLLPKLMRIPFANIINLSLLAGPVAAQVVPPDITDKYEKLRDASAGLHKPFFQSKGFRASIVPMALIAYGTSTINGHGRYSNYDVANDIYHQFGAGRHIHVDEFLLFATYLELGDVLLPGVETHNNRVNLVLVVLKREIIVLRSMYVVKTLAKIERSNGSNNQSIPSRHTAQAFLAAGIVPIERRDESSKYGIEAYTMATGVGGPRMVNDKHRESIVIAEAGFSILSTHLAHPAYLSHCNRWSRKPSATTWAYCPVGRRPVVPTPPLFDGPNSARFLSNAYDSLALH